MTAAVAREALRAAAPSELIRLEKESKELVYAPITSDLVGIEAHFTKDDTLFNQLGYVSMPMVVVAYAALQHLRSRGYINDGSTSTTNLAKLVAKQMSDQFEIYRTILDERIKITSTSDAKTEPNPLPELFRYMLFLLEYKNSASIGIPPLSKAPRRRRVGPRITY